MFLCPRQRSQTVCRGATETVWTAGMGVCSWARDGWVLSCQGEAELQHYTESNQTSNEREFLSSPPSEIQLTGRNANAGSVFSTFFKLSWHACQTDSFKGTVFQLMCRNHPDETTLSLTPYYSFLMLCSPALCWPGLIESAHSCVEWVKLGLIQHWGGSSFPQVEVGFSLPTVPWFSDSAARLQSKSKAGEDSFQGRS